MPTKSGDLTKGEQAFLAAFVATGDRVKAEKAAGYTPNHGYAVLARPEIQARYTEQVLASMRTEAAPLAVRTLIEIMGSAKAPAAARVQAAKVVLDRALPQEGGGSAKELHEMTPDELSAAIQTLEAQAASMAKPVPDPGIFD